MHAVLCVTCLKPGKPIQLYLKKQNKTKKKKPSTSLHQLATFTTPVPPTRQSRDSVSVLQDGGFQ